MANVNLDILKSTTAVIALPEDFEFGERLVKFISGLVLQAHVTDNGRDALDLCRRHGPDFLISAVRLAGLDGLDLVREARGLETSALVIMLAGREIEGRMTEALDAGVDRMLPVPVKFNRLAEAMVKLCWQNLKGREADRLYDRATNAEARLRELEDRHINLIENLHVGVWEVTPDGESAFCNTGMCNMLQIGESREVEGELISGFFDAASLATLTRLKEDRIRGVLANAEVTVNGRMGGTTEAEVSVVPVLDQSGRPRMFVWSFVDIAGRKAAELEIQKTQGKLNAFVNELEFSNIELQNQTDNITALNAAMNEFFSVISHRIRTPVNGIAGTVELLMDTQLTDEQRDYMSMVRSSSENLLAIVGSIIELSRLNSGKYELTAVPFDLRDFLEKTFWSATSTGRKAEVECVLDIDEGVPQVLIGDADKLKQVLQTLIEGSMRCTGEGSVSLRVEKRAEEEGKTARLAFLVADTGAGIPEDKLTKIFEPFAVLDIEHLDNGTGLGLTIAARLVKVMGGSMQAVSHPGVGSVFEFDALFRMPTERETGVLKDAMAIPVSSVQHKIGQSSAGGLRVLLVEDHLVNRKLALRILEKAKHIVTVAVNGADAVDKAMAADFDVIVMDVQMPVMDGFEATRRIREMQAGRGVRSRIIAMTAFAMKGDRERCLEAGMDDYIAKPIVTREFLAEVERGRPAA